MNCLKCQVEMIVVASMDISAIFSAGKRKKIDRQALKYRRYLECPNCGKKVEPKSAKGVGK